MNTRVVLLVIIIFLTFPVGLHAASQTLGTSVAVGVPLKGTAVSYGDLVIYDQTSGVYALSQQPDDGRFFGVVVNNPAVALISSPNDVPVMRQGQVLVNVTMENGPISVGDSIISSSIPGKGMRAPTSSVHVIGTALEAFTGQGTSTTLQLKGKSVSAGTILVDIEEGSGGGVATYGYPSVPGPFQVNCTPGTITCSVLQKINAAPLVTLMRYLIAAVVSLGSLYLAFRSFMMDAVNGVISVGRNPRAKASIQAMVVFNAVLAAAIAIAGLAVGLLILFIQV